MAKWNRLNPDDPQIEVGQATENQAQRSGRCLSRRSRSSSTTQYDWRSLAERFDVEVNRLRAYNPGMEELKVGDVITVWIDPKPYEQAAARHDSLIFDVRPDAISIGRPNDGRLQDGIQLPESDLYTRRHGVHSVGVEQHDQDPTNRRRDFSPGESASTARS